MPGPRGEACQTCACFDAPAEPAWRRSDTEYAACKRRAPVIVVYAPDPGVGRPTQFVDTKAWPYVHGADWCHEWAPMPARPREDDDAGTGR